MPMSGEQTNSPDLKIFAKEAFETLGSVIQEVDRDTIEILIPDEWTSYFHGQDIFRLRFSGESRANEIFRIGTPVFESLVSALAEKGSLAKAYLNPPPFKVGNLEEKFLKRIHWVHAKPYLKMQSPEETANAVFCFKVSFLTDDKTERLYRAAVNLRVLEPHERLLQEWRNLFLEAEPSYQGILPFQLPAFEVAHQGAVEILEQKISPELEKTKTLQEKFLRCDLASMEEYYSSLAVELEEKEKRLLAEEPVLEKIRDRKKTLSLDRMKKISDLQAKYRLDIEAKLVNLLILYQPWVRMVWGLRTREGELERVFYWDPILKEFYNVFCEECRKSSETFFVQNRKLICRTCCEEG